MNQENGLENKHNGNSEDPDSGLAHIEFSGSNPFQLFKEWHAEARGSHLVNPDAFCFSTCGKEGKPSSRHLLLRRLDNNGFVIMTDGRSRKSEDLADNPHASLTFLWSYIKDSHKINRQVRIEGRVEELPQSSCLEIWEREPLFCKIRANLCDQGRPVDWGEHKRKHDSLYDDVIQNKWMPTLPNHVQFYKVIPNYMDFYYAYNNCIGDRLSFNALDNEAKLWKVGRVAA